MYMSFYIVFLFAPGMRVRCRSGITILRAQDNNCGKESFLS